MALPRKNDGVFATCIAGLQPARRSIWQSLLIRRGSSLGVERAPRQSWEPGNAREGSVGCLAWGGAISTCAAAAPERQAAGRARTAGLARAAQVAAQSARFAHRCSYVRPDQ